MSEQRVDTDEEIMHKNFTGKLSNFLIGEDLPQEYNDIYLGSVPTPPIITNQSSLQASEERKPHNLRLNLPRDL